jgi:hypothetical protein
VRHRSYQVGYGASAALLLAAAVFATVFQRFFVAAIVPGIAFALAALWFRRKARTLSEPAPGLARIDVQVRLAYWDAPELSTFKSRPRLVASIAALTPGTIGCFLDVGIEGVIFEPSGLMRLIGLHRTDISWSSLARVEVRLGGGPLGNSVVLRFTGSGDAIAASYPSDVDLAPTLAAAVARSTNPGLAVGTVRPDSPRWQAWQAE